MLRLTVVRKCWSCPRVNVEVRLCIETLQDQTTGRMRSRKFRCDTVYLCPENGPANDDYSTCPCPDAPSHAQLTPQEITGF